MSKSILVEVTGDDPRVHSNMKLQWTPADHAQHAYLDVAALVLDGAHRGDNGRGARSEHFQQLATAPTEEKIHARETPAQKQRDNGIVGSMTAPAPAQSSLHQHLFLTQTLPTNVTPVVGVYAVSILQAFPVVLHLIRSLSPVPPQTL